MVHLGTRLKEIRKELKTWNPHTGFTTTDLRFTPADIVFGRRIAGFIKKVPDHKKNPSEIVLSIRREALADDIFQKWLLRISILKLRSVVEFSYFRIPPEKSGDKNLEHHS